MASSPPERVLAPIVQNNILWFAQPEVLGYCFDKPEVIGYPFKRKQADEIVEVKKSLKLEIGTNNSSSTQTSSTETTIMTPSPEIQQRITLEEINNKVPIPSDLPEKSIAVHRVLYQLLPSPSLMVYDFKTPEFTGRRIFIWQPKNSSNKGWKFTNFITQKTTIKTLLQKKKQLNIPWQESGRCERIVLNCAVAGYNEEITSFLMKQKCDSYDLDVREYKFDILDKDAKRKFKFLEKKERNKLCNILKKYNAEMPLLKDIVSSDLIADLLSNELVIEIKKDHPIVYPVFRWITIPQLKDWLVAHIDLKNFDINKILKMINVVVDAGWPIEKRIVLRPDQVWTD